MVCKVSLTTRFSDWKSPTMLADKKSNPALVLNDPFITKSPWNGSAGDAIGSFPLSGNPEVGRVWWFLLCNLSWNRALPAMKLFILS